MKLRIKGNSIRLRLLRSEVNHFAERHSITDAISFGENELKYSLVMSREAGSISASFASNEIAIIVPERDAHEWAAGESVGLESEQAVRNGEMLSILIEKDFACLDRPEDPDRDDTFPNPNLECLTHHE